MNEHIEEVEPSQPTRDTESEYLKTVFLARLAHELRGPTGVVHGALRELEEALGPDVEKFRPLLVMADRGVRRVLRTAMLLEETAQFEQGKIEFHRELIDVVSIVAKAAEEADSLEARRKIKLELSLPKEPIFSRVDGRWMTTAISEIFSNAIRHASSVVSVRLTLNDKQIEVECTDDNRLPEAFGPVRFQATREQRGHGLALAIARDVVAGHDGTISIELGPGKFGTRVTVRLPLQAGPATSPK